MANFPYDTTHLLHRLRAGDAHARNGLLLHTGERLRRLASRMLSAYPCVRRREQTDDLMQNALIRLDRALSQIPVQSSRHFWNLAAVQLRRALLDLADHYQTALEPGKRHHTDRAGKAADDPGGALDRHPDSAGEPDSLEGWTRFHEAVEGLPEEEREVFSLIWYHKLSQAEVAEELNLSPRTVRRRWQSAQLALCRALGGECPC